MNNNTDTNENVNETAQPRIILVGTYKGDQLSKWAGWYCYPITENDKDIEEYASKINELWLFKGMAEQKTRRSLIYKDLIGKRHHSS